MNIPDFNDFVLDINGFIGTPDTVLPYTAAYYIKHGYKKPKLNTKLIEEILNQTSTSTEERPMAIRGDITLAELHEIKATCQDYNVVDGCDTDCPYCYFNIDSYVCKFGKLGEPLLWDLPKILEMKD